MTTPDSSKHDGAPAEFPPTRWSLVLRLQGEDEDEAGKALEELCGRYWLPLYLYARRRNLSPADAEDATQGFFVCLISRDSFGSVDQNRGRMRSFLLGGMKNFLAREWRDQNTLKRGRGVQLLSIDTDWAEVQLVQTPQGGDSGDESFDRSWALALLGTVMDRMKAYYKSRGRLEVFDVLKPALQGDGDYGAQTEAARALGITGDAVRSQVHQMRARFRRYIEEEVRETVTDASEVRDELTYLCRILAGGMNP